MNESVVEKILGSQGRILSGDKVSYCVKFPDNEVFFNACIFDSEKNQIWCGDLDMTLDGDKLELLAQNLGTIYVTKEQPFRCKGFDMGRALNPEGVLTYGK